MDRGSYIAASGGLLQFRKLEIVNNNLANVNTPGFKREVVLGDQQTFDQTLAAQMPTDPYARGDHERTPGTVNVRAMTDFAPGPIKATGNPFDVALRNPNDFFVITTPQGQEYTRAGDFTINSNGDLVTMDGMTVTGDGGSITINGPGASIAPNGAVITKSGSVGTLQVARFDNPQVLERVGNSRFRVKAGQPGPTQVDPEVVPQSLEMPNVSAISSMVELITTQRAFEMYTKSSQSLDAMNQTAISQIGRRS